MPRPKDRPILFEVASRKGFPTAKTPSRPSTSSLSELARRLSLHPSRPESAAPSSARAAAQSAATQESAQPSSRGAADEGRAKARLVLGWPTVAACVTSAVLLVVVAFWVGRNLIGTPADNGAPKEDPLLKLFQLPAEPAVLDLPDSQKRSGGRVATAAKADRGEAGAPAERELAGAARPEAAPADPAARETTQDKAARESLYELKREKGRHYIVVQHFPKSKTADAEAAADFLRDNGVPCGLIHSEKEIRLIAAQGFLIDQKDDAARKAEARRCDEFKQRIKELGKQYSRTGRYAFDQCYADKY